jgi:hypothetical protein
MESDFSHTESSESIDNLKVPQIATPYFAPLGRRNEGNGRNKDV